MPRPKKGGDFTNMTYTFTCEQGHEPKTFTADAENDDEAMETIMAMAKDHLGEVHSDMTMTDEEIKNMIMGAWTKDEAVAQA